MRMLGTLSHSRLLNLSRAIDRELLEEESISPGQRSIWFRSGTRSGWSNRANQNPISPCTNLDHQYGCDWRMFHGNKDVCNDNANGHGPGLVLQKDHFLTEIVTNPKINVYALCLTMSSLKVTKKTVLQVWGKFSFTTPVSRSSIKGDAHWWWWRGREVSKSVDRKRGSRHGVGWWV